MNNMIKKIIQEELNRFEDKLYVFDFDETLITDQNSVFIVKPDGSKTQISHKNYVEYKKQPGERVEFDETKDIINPIINQPMMDLLRQHQQNAVILTARTNDKPATKLLTQFGIHVPVFAVGTNDPTLTSTAYNAKRKASWIESAIKTFRLKYVEFWDDNRFNIYEVEQLKEKYPEVIIKTNLVSF
jgi:hypothetical protein